jgi:hypothetical protein
MTTFYLTYQNPADADVGGLGLVTQNGTVLVVEPVSSTTPGVVVPDQFTPQVVNGPATGVAVTPGAMVLANTSAGAIGLIPPQGLTSASEGTYFGVLDDEANSSTDPITVGNGSTDRIEDPTRPGSYFSAVLIAQNSQATVWIWSPTPGGALGWKVLWCTPGATTSFVSVANITALEAYVNLNLKAGASAYVASVGALWTYEPSGALTTDGITVVAASNGGQWWRRESAIALAAVLQTAWFVDAQNVEGTSSDENNGLMAGTALRTKAEIARRLGTWSPSFNAINVVVTYLSADTTSGDPARFTPYFLAGATLTETAPLPAATFTGTLLAVTAKAAATNHALRSTFTVLTGAVAVNMLLVNSTRGNSRAFAQRNTGAGLWQISQPFTPYSGVGNPANTEVDTWANGDSITGYALQNNDIAVVGGVAIESQAPFAGPSHIVTNLTIWDPNVGDFDPCTVSGASQVLFVEAVNVRALNWSGAQALKGQIANCSINVELIITSSGPLATGPLITGGILNGLVGIESVELQLDVIVASTSCILLNALINTNTFWDTGVVAQFIGITQVSQAAIQYGAGTFNILQGLVRFGTTTAVLTFPLTGGLKINGATSAYSNATAAGLTTTHLLSLTPANIDAAAGAAGFGGLAYIPGVGAYQSGSATP